MKKIIISKAKGLTGEVLLPADKSISHRAVIVGAISTGKNQIHNFLKSDDCLCTIEIFKRLGVDIHWSKTDHLIIEGGGLRGLKEAPSALYFGNSGTGLRLTAGVLAACPFKSKLTGDESLTQRPMRRITYPLRQMGAIITGKDNANYLPLEIQGQRLKSIDYKSPLASAQVKSAILLAGLYAEGITSVTEPHKSRDHTERMLSFYGANLTIDDLKISVEPPAELKGRSFSIPADISSASFFMVAASILENSEVCLKSVGINPTRSGVIEILKKMGADIEIINKNLNSFEPTADIIVKSKDLKAVEIKEEMIPRVIDELPILMVAAVKAHGRTLIKNASELRVKETDRIKSMVTNLKSLGADIENVKDDIIIKGPSTLKGTQVFSFGDHRTAMSMIIAGLTAKAQTSVVDIECIKTSFPDFAEVVNKLKS